MIKPIWHYCGVFVILAPFIYVVTYLFTYLPIKPVFEALLMEADFVVDGDDDDGWVMLN